jgi:hypothetical protein
MNTDIRISVEFWKHPKTGKLERRLGLEGVKALMVLWAWVARNRPDGDLLGFDAEDIELAAEWKGESGILLETLVSLRWLDEKDGYYAIHDWAEHNSWAAGADDRSDVSRLGKLKQVNNAAYEELQRRGVTSISKEEYQQWKDYAPEAQSQSGSHPVVDASVPSAPAEGFLGGTQVDDNDTTGTPEVPHGHPQAFSSAPAPAPAPTPVPSTKDTPPTPPGEPEEGELHSLAETVPENCSKDMMLSGKAEDDEGASPAQELLLFFDGTDVTQREKAGETEDPGPAPCPHEAIIALYHEILPELPKIRAWGKTEKRQLNGRWNESAERQSLDWWREYFESIRSMDWLMGRVPDRDGREPFRADMLWLVGVKNMAKISAGRYRRGKSRDAPNAKNQSLAEYMSELGDDPLGLHTEAKGGSEIPCKTVTRKNLWLA